MILRDQHDAMATLPRPTPAKAQASGGFRFHNIDHPDKLKDKVEVQKNRRHVMRDWIAKESLKPMSTDMRVDGLTQARKRKRVEKPLVGVSDNPSSPSHIFQSDRRTSEPVYSLTEVLSVSIDRDGSILSRSGSSDLPGTTKRVPISRVRRGANDSQDDQVLGPTVSEPIHRHSCPNTVNHSALSPSTRFGSQLNPFETWPKFSDPSLDISELKWNCQDIKKSHGT